MTSVRANVAPHVKNDAAHPVLDMKRYVPGIINHLSNKLSRGASSLYRKRFGIGIIEWRIIAQLAISPASTARSLCDVTGLDKAAVSRSLRLLEARNTIALATATGQRGQSATLTPAGRKLHDRIITIALERERRLLACLDEHDRNVLVALLDRVYENLATVDTPLSYRAAPRRIPSRLQSASPDS